MECDPHSFLVTKAAMACNLVDISIRFLKQALGSFEAKDLDRLRRCTSGFLFVDACKIARAHAGLFCQDIDRQIWVAEITGDPGVEIVEGEALLVLRSQELAELRLSAGALQKDDQFAGDFHGNVTAAIGFDERKSDVDARADTG